MKIETIKKNKFENVKIGDKFQGAINNEIFTIVDITKDENGDILYSIYHEKTKRTFVHFKNYFNNLILRQI